MGKRLVYLALLLLAVLHQDFWLWNDPTLVFGFLPAGLAYHVLFSIAASVLWFLALTYAWPSDAEEFAKGEIHEQGKVPE